MKTKNRRLYFNFHICYKHKRISSDVVVYFTAGPSVRHEAAAVCGTSAARAAFSTNTAADLKEQGDLVLRSCVVRSLPVSSVLPASENYLAHAQSRADTDAGIASTCFRGQNSSSHEPLSSRICSL